MKLNKTKKTINQYNLVPITFGVLILKERNSKKSSPNQNCLLYNILMDSGTNTLIISASYINKIILLQGNLLYISGPQWMDHFLRHVRPKLN